MSTLTATRPTRQIREPATITATVSFDRNGQPTAYLKVDYDGAKTIIGAPAGIPTETYMRAVMAACGVDSWEQVAGHRVVVMLDRAFGRPLGLDPEHDQAGVGFLFADLV